MRKRIVSGVIAGLVLTAILVVVAYLVLPAALDSGVVKGKIAQVFKQKTGYPLTIKGDLKFSFLPDTTITLGRSYIENPSGFSQPHLADFEGATMVVRGIGLLLGQLDIRELSVDNLEVTLERKVDGSTNWPNLSESLSMIALGHKPETELDDTEDSLAIQVGLSGFSAIARGGIQLQGAKFHWHDYKKDASYSLENFSVVSRSLSNDAAELELNGNWKWHNDAIHGRISLDYNVHKNGNLLELKNTHLSLSSQSDRFFLREAECRMTSDVSLDMKRRNITLHDLEWGITGWFTRYALRDLDVVVKGTTEWDIDAAKGTMTDARLTFKIHSDDLPPAGLNVRLRSALTWQALPDLLTLSNLQADGPADTRLQGDLVLQGLLEGVTAINAQGNLRTQPFDPKALFVALGQPLPRAMDAQQSFKGSVEATFQANKDGVRADHFLINLDAATRVEGNGSWQRAQHPEARFALSLDGIDLDRYWNLVEGGSRYPEAKPLTAMLVPEISLAGLLGRWPKDLSIEGSLTGGQVRVSGATLEDFQLHMKGQDGVLTLDPFRFRLYQGEWKQKIQVDNHGSDPKLLVEKEMKGIQLQPFLSAIAGVNWLSGTMDLSGQVETSGKDFASARKNLKGSYWLGMKNAALQGIDLTESIRQIAFAVDGRPVVAPVDDPVNDGTAKTTITELTATARASQGRLTNSDLLAISHSAVIKGKGEADLVNMTVDYTFTADAQAALKGMDFPYWDQLEGAVLPIHVVGPFTLLKKPSIGEPLLTRRLIAARQNHQLGTNLPGDQNFIGEGPPFNPMVDAAQRNRRPMTRWSRGLFP
ncbi:MAG: AsmA family protein [Magnetococcales bacterium]|nr:AsmA family protein [Magnetococcales bacterium]